jgi:GABA(A) receptor-associated protein
MDSEFKKQNDFEKRLMESTRIRKKYTNRIPIICEKKDKSTIIDLDKYKYLVPMDITLGQFTYIIRKRIKLKPDMAIFITINNKIYPNMTTEMGVLYEMHKNIDGFLYLKYSGENVFG